MSRYIDADALKVSYCKQCLKETGNEQIEVKQTPYCAVACQDFDVIEKQPTVDAVPVVRCSKCVHFVEWTAYEKTHCGFQYDGMCKYWNCISTNKNSFCDHGIRITDGYCADGEKGDK